jgi:hypothetical protein
MDLIPVAKEFVCGAKRLFDEPFCLGVGRGEKSLLGEFAKDDDRRSNCAEVRLESETVTAKTHG